MPFKNLTLQDGGAGYTKSLPIIISKVINIMGNCFYLSLNPVLPLLFFIRDFAFPPRLFLPLIQLIVTFCLLC